MAEEELPKEPDDKIPAIENEILLDSEQQVMEEHEVDIPETASSSDTLSERTTLEPFKWYCHTAGKFHWPVSFFKELEILMS